MDEIVRALECLELKPGATQEEVRKAYRELAMVWHPDRFPIDSPLRTKAEERLRDINQAYDYLMKHGFVDGLPVLPPASDTPEPAPPAEPPIEPETAPPFFERLGSWLSLIGIALLLCGGYFFFKLFIQQKTSPKVNPISNTNVSKNNLPTPPPSNAVVASSVTNTPAPEISILPVHSLYREPIRSADGEINIADGELVSEEEFTPPFTLHAIAKTDSTNIRLYFGKGVVIFNWEVNLSELRYEDPLTRHLSKFPGKGRVEPNAWQDIRWVVQEDHSSIIVNDRLRAEVRGNYRNLTDVVGIGGGGGCSLTVRHFTVTSRGPRRNPTPPNLTSNLVLHFSFDEVSTNNTIIDQSPFHNNGRVVGVTSVPEGKLGGAFDFRGGVSNYVVVPHSLSLVSMQNTRQMTIAVWLKPRSLINEYPVVVGKGGKFPPRYNGGYELILNAVNDLVFQGGDYGLWTQRANGQWISKHFGEWIHLALVVNAETGESKFYVNGRRTGDEQDFNDPKKFNFAWPVALYVGVPTPNNHPNRGRYDGLMDDLRIYSRALTSEEIRALPGLAEQK